MDPFLVELHAAGVAAWPGLDISLDVFAAHVAPLLDEPGPRDGAGLYLATACTLRLDGAVDRFEQHIMPAAREAIARIDGNPAHIDEVTQQLRVLLFVDGEDRRQRIAGYSGRGSLAGWLRVVASRLVLDLRQRRQREGTLEDRADSRSIAADVLLLAPQHTATFEQALRSAFRELTSKQRTLLRLAFVEGVSGEDIGRLYGVHRSTVSRWLAEARDIVYQRCATQVKADLAVGSSELDTALRALQSGIDASLTSLLETTDD